MYWPDTKTGIDIEPARKPVASAVRKYFTEGGQGQAPTVPGGDWFNQTTNELLNVLAAAGIDPSKTDDDQLLKAIQTLNIAGLTLEGVLEEEPSWDDVPAYKDGGPSGSMNEQAMALAARSELLKARGDGYLYAGVRAYAGTETRLSCLGRSTVFDGGDGVFVLDPTDTTSPDDDGTILVGTGGKRWKRQTSERKSVWFGVNPAATDVAGAMLKAIAGGGEIKIADGQYNLLTVVKTDFTGAIFPLNGKKSARYNLAGASKANTTFNTNGNDAFYHIGNAYVDEAQRGQGIYSGMTWSDFTVYGTNDTGRGLVLENQIGADVKNINLRKLAVGLRLKGVLVSDFDNLNVDFCKQGLYMDSGANSPMNSVNFSRMKFGSCCEYAINGVAGTKLTFSGVDVENCGWGEGDVGGSDATGAIKLDVTEPLSVITFKDMYFEGNEGLADIVINNLTPSPIIVKISGCVFVRGNRRGKGCKYNFYPSSTGGGPIILVLDSNFFFTQTNGGYVPASNEPVIFPRSFLRVYGLDKCVSSQRVNVSTDVIGGSTMVPVNVSSLGKIVMGPQWLSCTKTGTGSYKITSTYTLGVNVNAYSVFASPVVTGFRVDVQRINEISFDVRVRDSTGTLTDGAFSVGIVTGAGEGR